MKHLFAVICLIFCVNSLFAQKKPLDHSVYDGWQAINERVLSNNGQYLVFTVNPQEGDGNLVVQSIKGNYKKEFPRGYGAEITEDNKYLIFKIKPSFKDTRDAKIKKKKAEDILKDTLAYLELGKDNLVKVARVKNFKIPEDSGNWLAYLLEKSLPDASKPKTSVDSATQLKSLIAMADSLMHKADSLRLKVMEAGVKGLFVLQNKKSDNKLAPAKTPEDPIEEGTDLVLVDLRSSEKQTIKLVTEYYFNKNGTVLLTETSKKNADTTIKASVTKLNLINHLSKSIFVGFNDAKGYRMDEAGTQVAFVAETDSSAKALQKFYKLFYYKDGVDSAECLVDKKSSGIPANFTVSETPLISFSKSGKRLFFGISPILPVKDTSLPDFERVSVDIWHYNDDYIQPMQLKNLEMDLRKSYTARYDFDQNKVVQLANPSFRNILQTNEGDGKTFYALADSGNRIAYQWQGYSINDLVAINPVNGEKAFIAKGFKGSVYPSYTGKYLLMFDEKKRNYNSYNAETKQIVAIAKDIKFPLYDVENDVPDDPNAYGIMGWTENDAAVLIYDQFDIWQVDPTGLSPAICITAGLGRKNNISYRNISIDKDEKYFKNEQQLLFAAFNNTNKAAGLQWHILGKQFAPSATYPARISGVLKAKNAAVLSYGAETYQHAADIRAIELNATSFTDATTLPGAVLYQPNAQQSNYNWGTTELFKWKAYTGKETEGIIYKPEDFDPKKKYPMIVYFYERNNNTLYNYLAPSPTPSRLNIPFFVSRGYIVFVPDIWYKTGYPGQSAYDYIVSGTRAVVKQGYVDSTKLGLQGQSWGGYQIVYLITKTNLYAAAWAGAPVANMTSAYGGIRWGSGMNRQFQYEKTQSRIGATIWEKPNLYIENSALFSLPKVKTPLVVMANDADDAVPWYQGIEMYTGMRRLGKKVWLLDYNNEAHNLIERRNKKDIQIREQQFFDYLLKGDKPAKWIAEGVPAIMKGRDWGLGY